MRCAICGEELLDADALDAVRWGPEWAHRTCVIAFNHGKADGAASREAEVEALRADAERYRWAREHGILSVPGWAVSPAMTHEWDAAINAARAEAAIKGVA